MSRLFNNINKGFSRIFRVFLFILSAFLIIYFFPKSGKFKYSFENGRPWQSENLYAPFDFAIKKTNDEISLEINQAKINTPLFFDIDTSLTSATENSLNYRINELETDSSFIKYNKAELIVIKEQSIKILEIQKEGKSRQPIDQFLIGNKIKQGEKII